MIKLKTLESELSAAVKPFERPKIELEQYPTSAQLAANVIYTAACSGDIEGRAVIDLGVGCGMLSAAAYLMGAKHILGIDVDPDALRQAKQAFRRLACDDQDEDNSAPLLLPEDGPTMEFLLADITELLSESSSFPAQHSSLESPLSSETSSNIPKHIQISPMCCDTVIMNPPFGTKMHKGIDMKFLSIASQLSRMAIYSLHKTSTRAHVLKEGARLGFAGKVVAEMRYDLPQTYKFHKKKSVDIEVDLVRFERT